MTTTSKNFLPEYTPNETQGGERNTLPCLKRDRAVPATQEEQVRQRILNWLVKEKEWPKSRIRLEHSYEWVGDPARHRIRPDIELLDNEERTLVVVECKAPGIELGPGVAKQAREYAVKSGAKQIWLSNGDHHKFLIRKSMGTWIESKRLEPLETEYAVPTFTFNFPNPDDSESVRQYFETQFPEVGYTALETDEQRIALSFHKLLFDMRGQRDKSLPFSFEGVHVLEDRGADYHDFSNRGGGSWLNLYADFIAATSGRVEALSVAVTPWGGEGGGIRLCVGVRKANRSHHAMQMDLKDCEWIEGGQFWRVHHDGKMFGIRSATVIEAVKESGAGNWLKDRGGKTSLYLGKLHWAGSATWKNSRKLLANVLHYGLIRTNLRDAHYARARKTKRLA